MVAVAVAVLAQLAALSMEALGQFLQSQVHQSLMLVVEEVGRVLHHSVWVKTRVGVHHIVVVGLLIQAAVVAVVVAVVPVVVVQVL
jgi:hypothetical protein